MGIGGISPTFSALYPSKGWGRYPARCILAPNLAVTTLCDEFSFILIFQVLTGSVLRAALRIVHA